MNDFDFDELAATGNSKRKSGIIAKILMFFAGLVLLGFVTLIVGYLYVLDSVPKLNSIAEYKPALVTKVLANDGRVMGEFSIERRYLLNFSDFSQVVVNAFISAEDESFFDHSGINPKSIIRAFIANLREGRVVQGGSTITQQVAKTLLLSGERKYERKIKEAVLASHMERNLTKNDILYLYLNQIYLGHGAYGVEAASKTYFRKRAKDLTIAEAALLAGLVPAPSKYDPLKQPKKARVRQQYVLDRMKDAGHITAEQYESALNEEIKLFGIEDVNLKVSPYYVEHVRQYILDKYGQDQLYKGGLVVTTAADYELSLAAQEAVRDNLHDLDKRQGYRGPIKKIETKEEQVAELRRIRWEVFHKKYPLFILPKLSEMVERGDDWTEFTYERFKEKKIFEADIELLIQNEVYPALVTSLSKDRKAANVLIGSLAAKLPIENMTWAARIKENEINEGNQIKYVNQAIEKNDLILVRVTKLPDLKLLKEAGKPLVDLEIEVALEQEPIAQSALLSLEAKTGRVVAMVGGYNFEKSEYNRALQGERQVGSAFKPFLYSAALDKGFTPASIIVDSPLIFENQGKENLMWAPENNSETFYGDTTLRMALIKSRNVPSIKLLQDVEIPYFLKYAEQIGILSPLNADLSIALGSNSMTLLELTKAYSLFPRGGVRVNPVFVLRVTDRDGTDLEVFSYEESQSELAAFWKERLKTDEENIVEGNVGEAEPKEADESIVGEKEESSALEEAVANATSRPVLKEKKKKEVPRFEDPLRAMDSKTAYIMGQLLQEVVQFGTGRKAAKLKSKVGGKTGTTNEYRDAWFMGFSPQIVTGVWTGFDSPRTMGRFETGSKAALPTWVNFMASAIEKYPRVDLEVPSGIVFVRINADSGKLASIDPGASVREAFVEGTEPTRRSRRSQQVPDSNDFFQEDF